MENQLQQVVEVADTLISFYGNIWNIPDEFDHYRREVIRAAILVVEKRLKKDIIRIFEENWGCPHEMKWLLDHHGKLSLPLYIELERRIRERGGA